MTAQEMYIEVNLRTQKINSNVNDNFLGEEVAVYINRAINEFISDRLLPESNYLKEGFEQSQKRIDDLKALVKKNEQIATQQVATEAAVGSFFADRANFPSDYRHLLSVRFNVEYARTGISFSLNAGAREADGVQGTDYAVTISVGRFFQSDDIYTALLDPHNSTRPNAPIYDISENGVDVYTDDTFIVPAVIFNYIKQPAEVVIDTDTPGNNVDCDLASSVHGEIVDMAVKMILADIEKFGPQGLLQDLEEVE